jgi:transcriptional regulator with XRE-family HTH domain
MVTASEIFIKNLIDLRESKGLTQANVAESLDITLRRYQRYEYGDNFPKPETIDLIAEFYQIEAYELLSERNSASNLITLKSVFDVLSNKANLIEKMSKIPSDSRAWQGIEAMINGALNEVEKKSQRKKES